MTKYLLPLLISASVNATEFQLFSSAFTQGESMHKLQEFAGFGCDGENLSPDLSWKGAPKGTKSFALTMFDPDAPTGSGWWHWQVIDIPANTHTLVSGAGNTKAKLAPTGSRQLINDYSQQGYGGPCPPKGHGPHRYQFTLYALNTDKLSLPVPYSAALAGYMIKAHTIQSVTLEPLYQRNE